MAEQKAIRLPYPIGTLESVEAAHLDPQEFFVCGAGSKDSGINACPYYLTCRLRGGKAHNYDFGTEVIRGKSGPEYFAMQELANKSTGRKVINTVRACFELPDLEEKAEASRHVRERGSILRIIARQGQEYAVNTHGPVDEDIPGQGKRRTWHPQVVTRTVPVFPTPLNNPKLADDKFLVAEAEKFFASEAREDTGEFFGGVTTEPRKADSGSDKGNQGKPATRG